MSLSWKRKYLLTLKMLITGDGYKKADILKKEKIFGAFGEKIYWFSRNIPSEPENVYLHDNVKIASNVYFCTHDIIDLVFNDEDNGSDNKKSLVSRKYGNIEIGNNVFIGANSTIMYDVKIGDNVIVAANSVVTKNLPEGVVAAGNPARIIGDFDSIKLKRRAKGISSDCGGATDK